MLRLSVGVDVGIIPRMPPSIIEPCGEIHSYYDKLQSTGKHNVWYTILPQHKVEHVLQLMLDHDWGIL